MRAFTMKKSCYPESPLSDSQLDSFHEDGFLVIRGFYDKKNDIEPIQRAIYNLVQLVIHQNSLNISQPPFTPSSFDYGYNALIELDRSLGGVVYDAIKQIPAFMRLVSHEKNERIMQQLRCTSSVAIGAGSFGIRIDNPGESQHLTLWHQEYPTHLGSLDGVIFWSPLLSIRQDMGPVKIVAGSHKDGVRKLVVQNSELKSVGNNYQELAKNLIIDDLEQLLTDNTIVDPLTNAGDLLIMDYRTVHSSSENLSNRSRWTMQMRYFNFEEKTGMSNNWIGGIAQGNSIFDVNPDLLIEQGENNAM
ncbi:MAG: phytanoyl-CoA dioxygenase [Alteromonas sp.]|nr:phytanoyl-CoA dioxygenase [Alteromonas sp.]